MRWLGPAAAAVAAVTIGVAAATGAFGGNSQPRLVGDAPPPPGAAELAALERLALQAAATMGDSAPTGGVLVPTTRRLAELVDVDTDEPDTPVYFVLVHGEFTDYGARLPKGAKPPTGTILTLTIDARTNQSLDTGLVGAMPDLNTMGDPEPLPLGTDLAQPTQSAPCAGRWWVRVRRAAVNSVAALQRYFEQPDRPDLPKGGFCDDVLHFVLVPTFVDGSGNWLVPRVPVDGCGEALSGHGRLTRAVHWKVVSVHDERLMVSAAALAAHCAMAVKNEAAGAAGQLGPSSGGPLFAVAPKTVNVCIYRTGNAFQVGRFVRGFRLDPSRTRRLLGALTGGTPRGSCPDQRLFATVAANVAAEVELGGCRRVSRPNLGGLGSAEGAVVRAILQMR